jgi:hypothetical protein
MGEDTPTQRGMMINPQCVNGHPTDGEGMVSPIAVKVLSYILQAAVWVVADDLPRDEWPTDAPAYTQAEVKILKQVGADTLPWVHATRVMFGARVVRGTPDLRLALDFPERLEEE